MWQRRKNPSSVARIDLAPACAAVIHATQYMICVQYDLMTSPAFDVGYESYATTILFVAGIV